MFYVKGAKNQNRFKQILLSKEKKSTCKDLNLAYYKLFHSRKCDSIFATSVIEVGIPLQNLKLCFGICVDTRKYIGKINTQGGGSFMSNKVILILCHITTQSYNIRPQDDSAEITESAENLLSGSNQTQNQFPWY